MGEVEWADRNEIGLGRGLGRQTAMPITAHAGRQFANKFRAWTELGKKLARRDKGPIGFGLVAEGPSVPSIDGDCSSDGTVAPTNVAVRFQFLSSNGALTFAGALPALMKRQRHMKKALAITAVSGIMMGTLAACGGAPEPPKAPSTDTAAPGAKASCSGATPATPATPGTPAAPTDPKAACSAKK